MNPEAASRFGSDLGSLSALAIWQQLRKSRQLPDCRLHTQNYLALPGFVLIRSRRLDSSRLARLRVELDHVFVCTVPGGPEAEEFGRFGLREGDHQIGIPIDHGVGARVNVHT